MTLFLLNFRFSTSRQTLTWIPDTFFTALLSGRISSLRDDTGAIFIDRDPHLFSVILNYLRTRDIELKQIDIRVLRHEAEYYNISPLIKRLILCEDLGHSSCGDVLFYGCLLPPNIPIHETSSNANSNGSESEPRSSTWVRHLNSPHAQWTMSINNWLNPVRWFECPSWVQLFQLLGLQQPDIPGTHRGIGCRTVETDHQEQLRYNQMINSFIQSIR